MNMPREQKVFFPVYGERQAELPWVSVFNHGEPSQINHVTHADKGAMGWETEIEEIVRQAREKEPADTVRLSVAVNLGGLGHKRVTGKSFSLALAIADKLARFSSPVSGRIIATGELSDHREVCAIGYFPEKLEVIARALDQGELRAGDVFIFPRANQHKTVTRQLKQLRDRGLCLRPIQRLDEVADAWGKPKEIDRPDTPSKPEKPFRDTLFTLGLLVAILYLLFDQGWLTWPWPGDDEPPLESSIDCSAPMLDSQGIAKCLRQTAWLDPGLFRVSYQTDSGAETPSKPAALRAGDRVHIRFKPSTPSWVYVYYRGPDGSLYELMSLTDRPNRVSANRSYHLPLTLDPHPGRETLYLLVSSKRLATLENQYRALLEARARQDASGAAEIQQALRAYLRQARQARVLELNHVS